MLGKFISDISNGINGFSIWLTGVPNKSFNVTPPTDIPGPGYGRPFVSEQYVANQNIYNGVKFNADSSRAFLPLINRQQFIPNNAQTYGIKFN